MSSQSNSLSGQGSTGQPPERTDLKSVKTAILSTIAYADVFDYPLTLAEIHRYLPGLSVSQEGIQAVLSNETIARGQVIARGSYFAFAGREAIVEIRERRARVAADMWPRALRYGRVISSLPYVRMVAVTGALAVDNVEPGDDIDYLVVTEPGHLWLCRAMIVALVKLAARNGDTICPNYLLSERALVFWQHSLFAAHELAQMVPVTGLEMYRRLRTLNAWTQTYLPNAQGPPRQIKALSPRYPAIRSLAERALRTFPGLWLEEWERDRKMRKFSERMGKRSDAAFSPDWCKGHFESHGQIILNAYRDRLKTRGIAWEHVA